MVTRGARKGGDQEPASYTTKYDQLKDTLSQFFLPLFTQLPSVQHMPSSLTRSASPKKFPMPATPQSGTPSKGSNDFSATFGCELVETLKWPVFPAIHWAVDMGNLANKYIAAMGYDQDAVNKIEHAFVEANESGTKFVNELCSDGMACVEAELLTTKTLAAPMQYQSATCQLLTDVKRRTYCLKEKCVRPKLTPIAKAKAKCKRDKNCNEYKIALEAA
ncbi:hypothetical protein C0993_001730 [Termitomyces sp. T159_Od127]|nr:hypothetical protein C0993_001730 [Termitomyces sp. T159_Od127]